MGHLRSTVRKIENHNILVTETLVIREATVTIIQKQSAQIIIESDSLIAIKAINEEINPPSHIRNLVEDVKILTQVVKNIKCMYRSRSSNILADMMAKEAHVCYTQLLLD